MKVTKKQVVVFNKVAGVLLNQAKGKFSPFLYALNKVKKGTESIVEDFNDDIEEARLKLAGKDSDGYVIVENEKYKMTPENTIKLNKKVKELQNEEVEVKPHITKDVPKDLSLTIVDALVPFVIEDVKEEK